MTEDEKALSTEQSLAAWRRRWLLFALVWVVVVGLIASVLWPYLDTLRDHELVLVIALIAVIPPALDYFFSLAILRLLAPRVQRRS